MVHPMSDADASSVENVLLITIDALRADHCGFLGYDGETTPFLDEVAATSAVFERAFSQGPGTPISFSSLFSSTYPLEYGGYETFADDRPSLPAHLQHNGVRTAGIHSNPYLSRHFGYHRGFDHFDDSFDEDDDTRGRRLVETAKREIGGLLSRNDRVYDAARRVFAGLTADSKPYVDAAETTDKAIEWLSTDAAAGGNFCWLHYLEPHAPYDPPDEYLPEDIPRQRRETLNGHLKRGDADVSADELADIVALYDAEIRYVDAAIERLFGALAAADLLAETAVVVTADHGEEFLDHGDLGHHPKLYDELLHVPLVVRLPGDHPSVIEQPVELLSVAPTVVDLLAVPSCEPFRGRSLLGEIDDGPVVSEVSNPHGILNVAPRFRKRACRHDGWKLVVDDAANEVELYDVADDPDETVDRSADREDIVAELRGYLDGYPERGDPDATTRTESESRTESETGSGSRTGSKRS